MEICFVTASSLNHLFEEKLEKLGKHDILVFGNGLGLVSYKKELAGETEYFHDIARLSKQLSSVVICGCDTDTYGIFRHSVVIADKGKLLGVTDMAHLIDDGEFVSGGNFKVYDTSAGKVGLIVQEDLFFPETTRILSLCDAEIIVCIFKRIDNYMPQIMLRACAFSSGTAMALCSKNYACVSDIRGKIILKSNLDIVSTKLKIEKDYHEISAKRRGLYREIST